MNLDGKRALVTGGAVRLGRRLCEALAAKGCTVLVHCRESITEGQALVAALEKDGKQAFCVQTRLDSEDDAENLIDASVALAGGLDILVNNASTFNKDAFMDADAGRLTAEIGINAFTPMYLVRAFARQLSARAVTEPLSGRIINILDRRIVGQEKGMLPYLLSKKMLADYTRIAALELGPRISVNAVAPGPVLPPPGKGDDYLHDHAGEMVLASRPTPDDVAAATLYLLEAEAVTGQIVYVDSGQHLL